MKYKSKYLLSMILLSMIFLVSFGINDSFVYSRRQIALENNFEQEDSWNATSPTEFFNETKHPRYPLVARPFGIIEYPHKGNPVIVEFGKNFNVLVNISQTADDWNMTLTNGTFSMSLNLISSIYEEGLWVFHVQPSLLVEGLFDLQVNCSLDSDYQTHAVKIVEEKNYPFTFVQITDTHFPAYSEPINTTDINLKEFEKIRALQPDFVILTGDFIQGPTWTILNPETGMPMSAEIQYRLALWAVDQLNLPVYIIHGNHDYSHSTILPDLPDVKWKKYMGHIRYQNFTYLDWSFIGYGSYFDGLTENELTIVERIVDDHENMSNILYYHHDYGTSQAKGLLNKNPIEVTFYGHEHHDQTFIRSTGALVHCQAPLFEQDFGVFTIVNSTAIEFKNITYDFTDFSIAERTTPPTTPTENTPFPAIIFITSLIYIVVFRKKKKFNS